MPIAIVARGGSRMTALVLALAACWPLAGAATGVRFSEVGVAASSLQSDRIAGSYAVDTDRSFIVAKLKKAGLLRFLGHEHGVLPGAWSAEVDIDPDDPGASRLEVRIETASLIIDTPEARRLAGVDPDGPDDDDVAEIRETMLSDEQLDAAAFPTILFTARRVRVGDDELRIEGDLTIHGERRRIGVDAELRREDDGVTVGGEFEIELRDFGIEPVSIGGVVKVANEVEIRFEIHAAASR